MNIRNRGMRFLQMWKIILHKMILFSLLRPDKVMPAGETIPIILQSIITAMITGVGTALGTGTRGTIPAGVSDGAGIPITAITGT